jgi:hypothetical protein
MAALAGPAATGKWIAIQNGIADLAGIVAPALTGWVIDQTGAITVAGSFARRALVSRVEPLTWRAAAPPQP